MGCWDIFCPLCGLSMNSGIDDSITVKYIQNWFFKCTLLLNTDEILHNAEEVSCNITFSVKGKEYSLYNNDGIALHTDCWKLIKQKHNIELKYSNFPIPLYDKYDMYVFKKLKCYNQISKYWSQDFMFSNLLKDKNEYMLNSPLKDEKNQKRVLTIFNKLKIREGRNSPLISASFFKNNTILIGNNNNLWQVKNGKWIEIKDTETDTFKIKIKETNETINIIDHFLNYETWSSYKKNILSKLLSLPKLGQISDGLTITKIDAKKESGNWIIKINVIYTKEKSDSWYKLKNAFEKK